MWSRDWGTGVFPAVFAVHGCEIEVTRPNVVDRAFWRVVDSIVVLLTKLEEWSEHGVRQVDEEEAYSKCIDVFLARYDLHARQPLEKVFSRISDVSPLTRRVKKLDAQPLPKANILDACPELGGSNGRQKRGKTAVQRSGVYVAQTF